MSVHTVLPNGGDPQRPPRWLINTSRAAVMVTGMAFDLVLTFWLRNPWTALEITLLLVAGLMLVTSGHIKWLGNALARLASNTTQDQPGPSGNSVLPAGPGLPTIGEGRRQS